MNYQKKIADIMLKASLKVTYCGPDQEEPSRKIWSDMVGQILALKDPRMEQMWHKMGFAHQNKMAKKINLSFEEFVGDLKKLSQHQASG